MAAVGLAAGAASLIPLLIKLYRSKHFWPMALGGLFLGQEALGQVGKARERGLAKEELQLQKLLAESQTEAAKRATQESRAQTREYMETLTKEKGKERSEAREQQLMEYFVTSQDRQMGLLMQALQGIAQARPTPQGNQVASGMVGLMRG